MTKTATPSSNPVSRRRGFPRVSRGGLVLLALVLALGAGLAAAPWPAASAQEEPAATEQVEGAQPPGAALTRSNFWFSCHVRRAGPGHGNVYLWLDCPGANPGWFKAKKDQEQDVLAAGLTALSAGKRVQVHLAGTTTYSEILACYVIQ